MRASGLATWTQSHRNAFGLDFQWHLAQQVSKPLSEIEPQFQAMLKRYGITDEIWDAVRVAPLEDHNGATYFRPQNIQSIPGMPPRMADEYASKMLDAMNTEMDFANPMPDARVRAMTTGGGAQRGRHGAGRKDLRPGYPGKHPRRIVNRTPAAGRAV